MSLQNKTIIVTGGCGGIGRAYIRAFAHEGANVVVADLAGSDAAAAELRADGHRAIGVDVDITSVEQTTQLAAVARSEFSSIDVMVNNAAFFKAVTRGPFEEIDPSEWDTCMDVNVKGTWLCTRAVTPVMKEQGSGRIVNISSNVVWKGVPGFLHYVTSKSAIVGFSRSLAHELGEFGITVNTVAPDFIPDDHLLQHQPGHDDFVVSQCLIKRTSVPDDMVGIVLFLASPATSDDRTVPFHNV
jgi:3-oxoacyl-[acyl-carrier protein] reductase|tara:strand:- start:304 stop:1032 length:729 start_codon:yes stop_codon:yes gene_type:complete